MRQNFAAVDAALAHLHEVAVPAASAPAPSKFRPAVSALAPEFVQQRHRRDHRRPRRQPSRQRLPGRRNLSGRHGAMGEAQYRAGGSGLGTRPLHRVRQVHAGLSARDDSREGLYAGRSRECARRDSRRCRRNGASFPISSTRFRSLLKTAPAASSASKFVPAKDKSNVSRKALNMTSAVAAARQRARQLGLLPDAAGDSHAMAISRFRSSRTFNCSSRCLNFPARAQVAARRLTSN